MAKLDMNTVLEIVISLVALMWLLSVICSYVVEAANSLLRNLRAKLLERFICEMVLGDEAVLPLWRQLKGKLAGSAADPLGVLSHGLVRSLRKPGVREDAEGTAPSYVPADVFAKALLDRLSRLASAAGQGLGLCSGLLKELAARTALGPAWQQGFKKAADGADASNGLVTGTVALVENIAQQTPAAAIAALLQCKTDLAAIGAPAGAPLPGQLHLDKLIDRLIEVLTPQTADTRTLATIHGSAGGVWLALMRDCAGIALAGNLVDAVRAMVAHAPLPVSLADALRPIVAHADFDLAQLRKGVENWFDSVMERATGWFKRNTTAWLAVCGFVLAALLNVNPVLIARDLARDPALRSAGVAFASTVQEQRGDTALVHRFAFDQMAASRNWGERLSRLNTTAKGNDSIQKLADEMRPLLLRSGQYFGLLPWTTTDSKNEKLSPEERRSFLDAVCLSWHEAQVQTGRLAKDAKPPAGITDCPSLYQHFTGDSGVGTVQRSVSTRTVEAPTAPASAASATGGRTITTDSVTTEQARGTAPTQPDERHKAAERFWSSSELVWDTALASALWQAQLDPGKTGQAVTAFKATQALNAQTTERVRSFLDRIPSLGWSLDKAGGELSCWQAIVQVLYKIVVNLPGWLLTALMVSFGAPFWFDLVSKLMNRRATGPKPPTVGEPAG